MAAALASPHSSNWLRRYPPLLAVVLAIILAIYALPSSLNLPQANPGQVAEYAPVPGNSNAAPPGGNFAGLGLGQGGAAAGGSGQALSGSGTNVKVPPQFDCVGNPPRQTADPMSPPCVAVFNGNNGGPTWQGVTAKQVTVMFHFAGAQGVCGRGGSGAANSCDPAGGYYDLADPNQYNKYFLFRYLHDWMAYFDAHYQAYGRVVHFYAYFDDITANGGTQYTTDDAAADAAKNWQDYHPFAAFDEVGAYGNVYASGMAQHQTLNFGGQGALRANKYFLGYPGFFWSFGPTIEQRAQQWASFVCSRIWKQPVSFDGDGKTGQARKLGLLTTDDQNRQDTIDQQKLSLAALQQTCGITQADFAQTGVFHYSGADISGPQSGWGVTNMGKFSQAGVTTILLPGGVEYEDQRAASELHYHPEWVLEGDDINDGTLGAINEPADEYDHAAVVTPQTLQSAQGQPVEPSCLSALLEVDPGIDRTSLDIDYACAFFYDDVRQLFTGIQLAGPHLTPTSMNEGFHAIPPKPSTGPTEPSCFYNANDYTCVKDAVVEWWDSTAQPESTANASAGGAGNGCWRMWRGGERYLPGRWPAGDGIDGWSRSSDICNLYGGGYNLAVSNK
jgi:hypothetical protein